MPTYEFAHAERAKRTYYRMRDTAKSRLSVAREKWCIAYLSVIEQVENLEEAIRVFRAAPRGYAKYIAHFKWVEFCTTNKELYKAAKAIQYPLHLTNGRLLYIDYGVHYYSDWTYEVHNPAIVKFIQLIRERLMTASKASELEEIHWWWPSWPGHGELKQEFLNRERELEQREGSAG